MSSCFKVSVPHIGHLYVLVAKYITPGTITQTVNNTVTKTISLGVHLPFTHFLHLGQYLIFLLYSFKYNNSMKTGFTIASLVSLVAVPVVGETAVVVKSILEYQEMVKIYELLKTPYKYGAVVKEDYWTDSPSVFFHDNKWYMTYIGYNAEKEGYESYIANSTDLVTWENRTRIFDIDPSSGAWDCNQVAGYMSFINNDLFGDYSLQKVGNHYYIAYLGGALPGYETDPLSIGEAYIDDDIMNPSSYHKFDYPVLTPHDEDVRLGEDQTLYKSNMFIDEAKTLGHKYVNFYNAKAKDGTEGVFIAVSDNGTTWKRYWPTYVFKDLSAHNTGDPVILKHENTYIMLYYILKDGKTYDNFAISKDLIHWRAWTGKPLIESTEEWENQYAHKPSMVYDQTTDTLYHFYCAVNTNGERFIAVAANKPFGK